MRRTPRWSARLRLHHGRMWRQQGAAVPAVALRLQGRDPAGVAQVLGDHAATVALLADTAAQPVPAPQPEPVEAAPEPPVEMASAVPLRSLPDAAPQGHRHEGAKTPAPRRSDDELFADASALNTQVLAASGTPVSVRRLKSELRVGQPTAERLRDRLAAMATSPPTRRSSPYPSPYSPTPGATRHARSSTRTAARSHRLTVVRPVPRPGGPPLAINRTDRTDRTDMS